MAERGGFEPTISRRYKGNPHNDTQRDSQISVPSSHDLSQVVNAWDKLPGSSQSCNPRHRQFSGGPGQ